jgi:hypothetical protein
MEVQFRSFLAAALGEKNWLLNALMLKPGGKSKGCK